MNTQPDISLTASSRTNLPGARNFEKKNKLKVKAERVGVKYFEQNYTELDL